MKKNFLQFWIAAFTLSLGGTLSHAQPNKIELPHSSLEVDNGSFWMRRWVQKDKEYTGIDLKTVTNFDSALLMTFSGADFAYLNQQAASKLESTGPNTYVWTFQDANIDYSRTYEIRNDEVLVHVVAKFRNKAPEKAFLNLVSQGMKDDPEERDREVFYYTNSSIERHKTDKDIDATEVATPVKWVGMGSRYFVLVVLPDGITPEKLLLQSTGPKAAQASLQFPVVNQALDAKFRVAFIPKKLDTLRAIDPSLDHTVNLGFFTFIAYPILWTLKFIYKYVGNYGIAIIILTILVKLLTFPLVMKSMKSMRRMAEFQPKMKALQERHKDDKETFNREMMLLMKSSGYNPMAGCFPMLLQMPIFFALYSVLYAAVELYHAPFFGWLSDLSARDHYFVTPVLMTLVMFIQQRLTPPAPGMDPAQQKVMQFMPLMFGAFMLTTPSGLCVYMLVNATFSVLQQRYLQKKYGVPGQPGMASAF
jgi:YidC/Oxa1 family membrane protein insertase